MASGGVLTTTAHDRIRGLLGAYALGALDDDERVAVDRHLELCSECRAEVAQLREAAASIVEPEEPAPADVWERVSKAIRDPLRRRPWQRSREGHG